MKLHEFYAAVTRYHTKHPEERAGQALFNVLYKVRPDLSEKIRGTKQDPFHATNKAHPRYVAGVAFINGNWYGGS